MPVTVIIKFSNTAAAVPTLLPGELAINRADEKLYYTNSLNVLKSLSLVASGSSSEIQQNNSIPLNDVTILPNYSAIVVRNFIITTGRKLTIGLGGIFKII